eukprot:Hpha_TRINITY_DN16436_c0_g16::TRINITY_DN16436_c0_g16_i1::g.164152::m.164152
MSIAVAVVAATAAPPVYTTYHWHLQQPIYWPDNATVCEDHSERHYQRAWCSYQAQSSQGGHPQNNLQDVFGKDDRKAVYQYRMADSIDAATSAGGVDAGASASYAADLIQNVESLAGQWGYDAGFTSRYKDYRSKTTSGGAPKLDLTWFSAHHLLAPLVPAEMLEMDLRVAQAVSEATWGPGMSKGMFPAEMAFSERIIPTLVKLGIEWVIVPNNHLSRACADYPFSPSGDNCDPPNKADQVNPKQSSYYSQQISRGCRPNNAAPFAFQPHKAQHVDPETGKAAKMTVVPAAMAVSWLDGYECIDTSAIDPLAGNATDPDHPLLILMAHDGDNAFGGGYSYYQQCVPNFVKQAISKGYQPSTVQQYLKEHPVADEDLVHVEDGAWVNKDGDFGSPTFQGWSWPPTNESGGFDIPDGWQVNQRNYAVVMAGVNEAATAAQMSGVAVRPAEVAWPSEDATETEVAWHFVLPAGTSGYQYYGAILDMPDKASVAVNNAVRHARKAIASANAADSTPPTMFPVQRFPQNPGGQGAGALWKYKLTNMSRDFSVYTYAYDHSGISNATLYIRSDADGVNPLDCVANEVYEPERLGLGHKVGAWTEVAMTKRAVPTGDQQGVKFSVPPLVIADKYFAQLTGYANVLLDYYVEIVDTLGNARKSDINHVFVE